MQQNPKSDCASSKPALKQSATLRHKRIKRNRTERGGNTKQLTLTIDWIKATAELPLLWLLHFHRTLDDCYSSFTRLLVLTFTTRILLRDDLSPTGRLAWFMVLCVARQADNPSHQ